MIQYELDVTMTAKQAGEILEEKERQYADHYPMTVLAWLSEVSSIDFQERIPWAVPYTCLDVGDTSSRLVGFHEMLGILTASDDDIVFRRTNDEGSDDWVLTSIAFPAIAPYNGSRGH